VVGYCFVLSPIHILVYDVSVFIVECSVPPCSILPTPNILSSIRPSECSLTIFPPMYPFPNIFDSIWINQNTKTIWFSILYITLILWLYFFISKSHPFVITTFTPLIKSFTFVIISNHRRRQKKEEGEENEYMSHLGSYKWIRKTQVIPRFG